MSEISWSEWAFMGLTLFAILANYRLMRWARESIPAALAGVDPSDSDRRRRTRQELRMTGLRRQLLVYSPFVTAGALVVSEDAGLDVTLLIATTLGLVAALGALVTSWLWVWLYGRGV